MPINPFAFQNMFVPSINCWLGLHENCELKPSWKVRTEPDSRVWTGPGPNCELNPSLLQTGPHPTADQTQILLRPTADSTWLLTCPTTDPARVLASQLSPFMYSYRRSKYIFQNYLLDWRRTIWNLAQNKWLHLQYVSRHEICSENVESAEWSVQIPNSISELRNKTYEIQGRYIHSQLNQYMISLMPGKLIEIVGRFQPRTWEAMNEAVVTASCL
jgi:hypothetical protein